MNKSVFWLGLIASLTCTACTTVLSNIPGVYKLDIEQGNMIDQSMIDQLRPNMTKRQVQFIMGSPMVVDTFHEQRWDYIYSKEEAGEDRVQKRVSLYFKGDNLQTIQGDFRPSSMPVPKPSTETSIDLPKRELEKSMWQKMADLFGFDPGVDTDDGVTPNSSPQSAKSGKSR
ncbi:outer membrane protein assembly factor BamE [Methylomonas sp. AM2-LC]|uniref:outer membrane protein assembly factor BamE n=1 Tax=Methylomonas sp. AM2-LC TaxID=3153301 RepID=UPI0032647A17